MLEFLLHDSSPRASDHPLDNVEPYVAVVCPLVKFSLEEVPVCGSEVCGRDPCHQLAELCQRLISALCAAIMLRPQEPRGLAANAAIHLTILGPVAVQDSRIRIAQYLPIRTFSRADPARSYRHHSAEACAPATG